MKLKNPLSADELERKIAAISNIKDEEINTTDIQPLTTTLSKMPSSTPTINPLKNN